MTCSLSLFYVSFYSEFEIAGAFLVFFLPLLKNDHSYMRPTAILSVQQSKLNFSDTGN